MCGAPCVEGRERLSFSKNRIIRVSESLICFWNHHGMCFFVFKGRQPSGYHEEALPGGVAGLCVQTAGDPREKEIWMCWARESHSLDPLCHNKIVFKWRHRCFKIIFHCLSLQIKMLYMFLSCDFFRCWPSFRQSSPFITRVLSLPRTLNIIKEPCR